MNERPPAYTLAAAPLREIERVAKLIPQYQFVEINVLPKRAGLLRPTWSNAECPDDPCEGGTADRRRHKENRFDPWREPEYDESRQKPRQGSDGRCRQRSCIERTGGPPRNGEREKESRTNQDRAPQSENASYYWGCPSNLYRTAPARSREHKQALLPEVGHERGEHRRRAEAASGGVVPEKAGQQDATVRRVPIGSKQKPVAHWRLAEAARICAPSGAHLKDREVTWRCIRNTRALATGGGQ